MGRKWHSFSNWHGALIAIFSVVTCQGRCLLGQGELWAGRWPWDWSGFQVPALCQRKGADSQDRTCKNLSLCCYSMCEVSDSGKTGAKPGCDIQGGAG